jgi:uncharacterized membrane protein YdfJ with MMPL/SSD domain
MMFAALGRFAAQRRRWVLLGTLVFLVFAGVWGTGAFGALTGGAGFEDPASESIQADHVLAGPLGRYNPDVVALIESPGATVDSAPVAGAIQAAVAAIPAGAVTETRTYWSTHDGAFLSTDRHATYVTLTLPQNTDNAKVAAFTALRDRLRIPGLTTRFGGVTPMTQQVNARTTGDIALAESLSLPILLILLVVIFRSAVAAAIPLAMGATVALGSFTALRVVTSFTEVSTFAINVVTLLGLGLAIDYGLFAVARFREELATGMSVNDAVTRTMATAGRTIVFSGVTVAVSLACLTLFPATFLRSMGAAGIATVAFAVLSSLFVLPMLLSYTGHRVNSWRIPLGRRRAPLADERQGRWYRVAKAVMRRPLVSTVSIVLVLLALGAPFLGVQWARPGAWVLPPGADARVVGDEIASRFSQDPDKFVTVVLRLPAGADSRAAVADYTHRLGGLAGVTSAKVTGTHENLARVSVGYRADPMSADALKLVTDIRAQSPPPGATAQATGMPASRADIITMILSRLPWMGLFVAVIAFAVLFLAFGSVVLPLRSILMNLLSLSASFGAIKLIFQDGWLSGLFNFVPVGAVDIDFPILIVAIAFGLSMDYEVFLLSRVREEYDRTGDTTESVALGAQRTANIITSAALLMAIVVGGFMTSSITLMKMIGVGLVIAVAVDATIVRGLLAPASMRLLHKVIWWSPGPLARWWARFGLRETESPPAERPALSNR